MRLKIIPKIQLKFYPSQLARSCFSKQGIVDFEAAFSRKTGIKYCAAAYTGRAALIAILSSLGLKKGDEIILPAFTFVGLAHIIADMGFKPVFADVSSETLNIDPEKIEELITQKTKVLLIVHNMGNPCEMDEIVRICRRNKLILIEDCAHSLGSRYKGKLVGTFGHASIFSFHYSKIINTFWGGMACTNSKKLASKIAKTVKSFKVQTKSQLLSRLEISFLQAIVTSPIVYSTIFYPVNMLFEKIRGEDIIETLFKLKPQDMETHKYQFTDFQARIGILELKKVEDYNRTRIDYLKEFREILGKKVRLQKNLKDAKFIPLQLVIFSKDKLRLIAYLKKNKVEAKDFYITYIPSIERFSRCRNNSLVAKRIADEIIYFPTFQYQSEKDIRYIAAKILSYNDNTPAR
ncbi:MAG: aminotransferase class I/II-fold pyridoxal phosphate-dependent enzyme [Candidatus Woesearchaeota archaeon]|nr:aminotransferase class I/II-fold pyridoxal phosphate-dependent enzyme [Candidatus Woesearchaeota archaeon]